MSILLTFSSNYSLELQNLTFFLVMERVVENILVYSSKNVSVLNKLICKFGCKKKLKNQRKPQTLPESNIL